MDPLSVAASLITIVSLTSSLAIHVKGLIDDIKEQDDNAKNLKDRLESLSIALKEACILYGPDDSQPHSSSEQQLRRAVKDVILRCHRDLQQFEAKLEKTAQHGNPALMAWKHKVSAPAIKKIEKSLSEGQQLLSTLLLLLDGLRLHQMQDVQRETLILLKELTGRPVTDHPSAITSSDQLDSTESLLSQVTTAISEQTNLQSPELPADAEKGPRSHEGADKNSSSRALLEAIEEGDHDSFASILRDPETSLTEKDGKDRTPFLLAAHLGREKMVDMLLAENGIAANEGGAPGEANQQDSSGPTLQPLAESSTLRPHTPPLHRTIDLTATDKAGRTALHYCAEFDLCDTAKILLYQGVDVNALDEGGLPPAYFAAKTWKPSAMRLLLARGARTDFERPVTSDEITELLNKSPGNADKD